MKEDFSKFLSSEKTEENIRKTRANLFGPPPSSALFSLPEAHSPEQFNNSNPDSDSNTATATLK
jgi:hypothetical protein